MKNKALFSKLVIAVCLVLAVICLEVFVFPLFSPTTTDASVSDVKPADSTKGTDVELSSNPASQNYDNSGKDQTESSYKEPTGFTILELHGCDDPDLTIWY